MLAYFNNICYNTHMSHQTLAAQHHNPEVAAHLDGVNPFEVVAHLAQAETQDPSYRGLASMALRAIDNVTAPEGTVLDDQTRRAPDELLDATTNAWSSGAFKNMNPNGQGQVELIKYYNQQPFLKRRGIDRKPPV